MIHTGNAGPNLHWNVLG